MKNLYQEINNMRNQELFAYIQKLKKPLNLKNKTNESCKISTDCLAYATREAVTRELCPNCGNHLKWDYRVRATSLEVIGLLRCEKCDYQVDLNDDFQPIM